MNTLAQLDRGHRIVVSLLSRDPIGRPTPPAPRCLLSGLASHRKSGPAAALLETFGDTARLLCDPWPTY